MKAEAFAGWVVGFLDGTGGTLSEAQVEFLRARAIAVSEGEAVQAVAPSVIAPALSATERVKQIREEAKAPKGRPRRLAPDPMAMPGLPEVLPME